MAVDQQHQYRRSPNLTLESSAMHSALSWPDTPITGAPSSALHLHHPGALPRRRHCENAPVGKAWDSRYSVMYSGRGVRRSLRNGLYDAETSKPVAPYGNEENEGPRLASECTETWGDLKTSLLGVRVVGEGRDCLIRIDVENRLRHIAAGQHLAVVVADAPLYRAVDIGACSIVEVLESVGLGRCWATAASRHRSLWSETTDLFTNVISGEGMDIIRNLGSLPRRGSGCVHVCDSSVAFDILRFSGAAEPAEPSPETVRPPLQTPYGTSLTPRPGRPRSRRAPAADDAGLGSSKICRSSPEELHSTIRNTNVLGGAFRPPPCAAMLLFLLLTLVACMLLLSSRLLLNALLTATVSASAVCPVNVTSDHSDACSRPTSSYTRIRFNGSHYVLSDDVFYGQAMLKIPAEDIVSKVDDDKIREKLIGGLSDDEAHLVETCFALVSARQGTCATKRICRWVETLNAAERILALSLTDVQRKAIAGTSVEGVSEEMAQRTLVADRIGRVRAGWRDHAEWAVSVLMKYSRVVHPDPSLRETELPKMLLLADPIVDAVPLHTSPRKGVTLQREIVQENGRLEDVVALVARQDMREGEEVPSNWNDSPESPVRKQYSKFNCTSESQFVIRISGRGKPDKDFIRCFRVGWFMTSGWFSPKLVHMRNHLERWPPPEEYLMVSMDERDIVASETYTLREIRMSGSSFFPIFEMERLERLVLTSHCTSVRERVRDNMNSLTAEYFRSSVDETDRKLWALRIEETKAAKNCLKLSELPDFYEMALPDRSSNHDFMRGPPGGGEPLTNPLMRSVNNDRLNTQASKPWKKSFLKMLLWMASRQHLSTTCLCKPCPPLRRDHPSTPQVEKLYRDDGRCGSQYPLPDGRPAQCNPWEFPCCATSGWCGETEFHCDCPGCRNYAVADCVTRTHCGKDTSCEPIVVEPAGNAERIIVIASAWIGPQKRFTDAKRNHVRYALKHGYGYFAVECNWSDRGFPHWSKLLIARHLLEGHGLSRAPEYLFWMDADSLFMNASIRIEDHLVTPNPSKDFIFSGEREMVINTGHFLLRKSQWSLDFLKEVYRMYPSPGFVEQGSVIAYLAGATSKDPLEVQKAKFNRLMVSSVSPVDAEKAQSLFPEQIRSHVQVMAMKTMNSYLNIYTKGDWILHFSGVSDKRSATAK
ncbi:hypothetical protein FOZ60_015269 [Perkinsus olseni]|uniref:Chitin-binding type-1 domain-containing protein n=1 Tax=Perkinsus olseni TaxID=32597 RepID=A0A7J6P855_PEROL|nr:hypothetical protein FOZ60_015269 [Perkinsus olseni]